MGCGCTGGGAPRAASPGSPSWAVDYAERAARDVLARELALNRVIEERNPTLRPTAAYLKGPLRTSSVRFDTPEAYIRYCATRERGKYNPNVRYPTP